MSKRITEPLALYCFCALAALASVWLPPLRPLAAILAALIGLMLIAAFHELGHGLVAVTQGYRFLFLVVGPLRLEETPDGPRVTINRSWEYAGGVCANTPERVPDERLRRAHMLVVLAGPVTNIAIAAAVFAFGGRNLPLPAALIGAASFGMGAMSLVPSRQAALVTDGFAFNLLRRNDAATALFLHRLRLSAAVMAPDRPASWPQADVAALMRELEDDPLPPSDRAWQSQLNDRTMVYMHLIDCGKAELAGAILAGAGDSVLAARQQTITLQAFVLTQAFHLAWYGGDSAGARRWLAGIKRVSPTLESDWQRAQAAILLADGDRDGARSALEKAKKRFSTQYIKTSVGALEWRWLTELDASLQQ